MNIKETADLCEDLELFDAKFGVREMVAAFVRVNIDDELFVVEEGNDPSELVYDEFCEVVARIFNGREWLGRPKAERQGLEVERELNAWLGASFLPKAEATIKARRRKGK